MITQFLLHNTFGHKYTPHCTKPKDGARQTGGQVRIESLWEPPLLRSFEYLLATANHVHYFVPTKLDYLLQKNYEKLSKDLKLTRRRMCWQAYASQQRIYERGLWIFLNASSVYAKVCLRHKDSTLRSRFRGSWKVQLHIETQKKLQNCISHGQNQPLTLIP